MQNNGERKSEIIDLHIFVTRFEVSEAERARRKMIQKEKLIQFGPPRKTARKQNLHPTIGVKIEPIYCVMSRNYSLNKPFSPKNCTVDTSASKNIFNTGDHRFVFGDDFPR